MNMREFNVFVPLADFMLCLTMTVFVLFISSLAEVNPEQQKKEKDAGLQTEGIFAVILEWPADSADDVDLYVENAERDIAFFGNSNVGLMHLEQDDRGRVTDERRTSAGTTVAVEKNEERIIIRGIVPGEYSVNVHMFMKRDRRDTPVKVTLYRVKGMDQPLVERDHVLTRMGEEHTMFRMTIDPDGNVTDVNELERPIVERTPRP
jgi:hypothetical protein